MVSTALNTTEFLRLQFIDKMNEVSVVQVQQVLWGSLWRQSRSHSCSLLIADIVVRMPVVEQRQVPNGSDVQKTVKVPQFAVHLNRVVDVLVVRRCSSSTVMTPPWSWRPALSSTLGGLTPHSTRSSIVPASGSSSELSPHQMAIRSHPGGQKMPANGISSELSAHKMARPGAMAHSRVHLYPRASSLSFSSLVPPLRPLSSGLLGRGDPRYFIYSYAVTDAGPASHRVRLWQGGPASTYCRFRCRTTLRYQYSSSSSSSTGTP